MFINETNILIRAELFNSYFMPTLDYPGPFYHTENYLIYIYLLI